MQHERSAQLTERQRQCLRIAAEGFTSKEIARQLNLSRFTIDKHLEGAMSTIGATSRAEASRLFVQFESQGGYEAFVCEPETLEEPAKNNQLLIETAQAEEQDYSLHDSGADTLGAITKERYALRMTLPPIGGPHHDLKLSARFWEIAKIVIFLITAFGVLIAAMSGLSLLF